VPTRSAFRKRNQRAGSFVIRLSKTVLALPILEIALVVVRLDQFLIVNSGHSGMRLGPTRHSGVGNCFPRNVRPDFLQYTGEGSEMNASRRAVPEGQNNKP
jgi:hypothetical protein